MIHKFLKGAFRRTTRQKIGSNSKRLSEKIGRHALVEQLCILMREACGGPSVCISASSNRTQARSGEAFCVRFCVLEMTVTWIGSN